MKEVIHTHTYKIKLNDGSTFYSHFGKPDWLKLFHFPYPIVPVVLSVIGDSEATEDDYWGFSYAEGRGNSEGLGSQPTVYRSKILLDVHFGSVARQVKLGRGKIVRVRIREEVL